MYGPTGRAWEHSGTSNKATLPTKPKTFTQKVGNLSPFFAQIPTFSELLISAPSFSVLFFTLPPNNFTSAVPTVAVPFVSLHPQTIVLTRDVE